EVSQVAVRTLSKVGQFDGIGQYIVAVETKERIAVEQYRRDAADQNDIVGDGMSWTGGRINPDKQGDRREHHFDGNADRPNPHPLPLVPGARTRRVALREGR